MTLVENIMALAAAWRTANYAERDEKEAALRAAVQSLEPPDGQPVAHDYGKWPRELPPDAIPVEQEMPKPDASVLAYIEDASVAIHDLPVVAWNSGTNERPTWWTGVPGKYIALAEQRWTVTHWKTLARAASPVPAPVPSQEGDRALERRASLPGPQGEREIESALRTAAGRASAPPGFVLAPLEPNDDMQAAGAKAIRFDTSVLNKIWTGNAVYRAMLAAIASADDTPSGRPMKSAAELFSRLGIDDDGAASAPQTEPLEKK